MYYKRKYVNIKGKDGSNVFEIKLSTQDKILFGWATNKKEKTTNNEWCIKYNCSIVIVRWTTRHIQN